MNAMHLTYQLKFRDYALFNTLHQFFSIPVQVAYAGLALLIALPGRHGPGTKIITALVAYLAIWVAQALFTVIYLRAGRYRSLLTEHAVQIQDDGFCDETSFSRCIYRWAGINRLVRRWGFVGVYVNAQAAFIIPDRAFQSAGQRTEFLMVLKEKIDSARRKLNAAEDP